MHLHTKVNSLFVTTNLAIKHDSDSNADWLQMSFLNQHACF